MKDNYLKIKELLLRLIYIIHGLGYEFKEWKESVWDRDLDEYDCCTGRECGCNGRTVRQNYVWDREW